MFKCQRGIAGARERVKFNSQISFCFVPLCSKNTYTWHGECDNTENDALEFNRRTTDCLVVGGSVGWQL